MLYAKVVDFNIYNILCIKNDEQVSEKNYKTSIWALYEIGDTLGQYETKLDYYKL
jgi:hypothetical protein